MGPMPLPFKTVFAETWWDGVDLCVCTSVDKYAEARGQPQLTFSGGNHIGFWGTKCLSGSEFAREARLPSQGALGFCLWPPSLARLASHAPNPLSKALSSGDWIPVLTFTK